MPAPHTPPPSSMPSGAMSPDMQSTMRQMLGAAGKTGQVGATGGTSTKSPRPVGTPVQEAKYLTEDVATGVLDVLPDFMQQILGIKSTDKPEEIARKKQMLQRYNQLNSEQQQVVQQQMHQQQEKKKQEEEERIKKEQEEKQKAEQDELPVPRGKKQGEDAMTKLQNDRKRLSSAG